MQFCSISFFTVVALKILLLRTMVTSEKGSRERYINRVTLVIGLHNFPMSWHSCSQLLLFIIFHDFFFSFSKGNDNICRRCDKNSK